MKTVTGAGENYTLALIQNAKNYNGFVICPNDSEANKISKLAAKMRYLIHYPLTYDELLNIRKGIPVHIVDAGKFIQHVLNRVLVDEITVMTVGVINDAISDEAEKEKEPKKPESPQEKQKDGSPAEMTDEA
jgi:large-conductance mechanosensitive channel